MVSTSREWLHGVDSCHSSGVPVIALIRHIPHSAPIGESRMRRRELVKLVVAAATWHFSAGAQQKAIRVIGFLWSSPGPWTPFVAEFREGLSETGYVEGQNLTVEYRWTEDREDRAPLLAADLVDRKVDVIVCGGREVRAAKSATRRSRSSSSTAIRSGKGWSPASPGRAATSQASASSPSR